MAKSLCDFLARHCPELASHAEQVGDVLGYHDLREVLSLVSERRDLCDLDNAGFKKLHVNKLFHRLAMERYGPSLCDFLTFICPDLSERSEEIGRALGIDEPIEIVRLVSNLEDLSDLKRAGVSQTHIATLYDGIVAGKVSCKECMFDGGLSGFAALKNPAAFRSKSDYAPNRFELNGHNGVSHGPYSAKPTQQAYPAPVVLERTESNRSATEEFLEKEVTTPAHEAVAQAAWHGVKESGLAKLARKLLEAVVTEEQEFKKIAYEGRQANLSLSVSGFMVRATISAKLALQRHYEAVAADAAPDLICMEVPQLPKHFECMLSSGGLRLLQELNAGGSSEVSEAWAFEVLRTVMGAQLVATEMELRYLGDMFPGLSGSMGRTDFAVRLAGSGEIVGVSITRAMGFRKGQPSGSLFHAFGAENAEKLLSRKLDRILTSTRAAVGDVVWNRQILFIWTRSFKEAAILQAVFQETVDATLRANTLVLVVVCADDRIFSNA